MKSTSTRNLSEIITLGQIKKLLLVSIFAILLFVVCNDIFMPWFVNQRGTVQVPTVIGLPVEKAKSIIDSFELESKEGDIRTSNNYLAGIVIAQNPPAGTTVKRRRRVFFAISGGEQFVQVPNLKGKTIRDAKFALERNGLKLGSVTYTLNDSFPANTIVGQMLPALSKISRGTRVSIVVSQGTSVDRVSVPDVVGKPLTDAGRLLANKGLKVGAINYQISNTLLPNTVLDQYPRAGELIEYGQVIDLFVIRGGEKKKSPTEN